MFDIQLVIWLPCGKESNYDNMLIRFDTIPERDGHTDGRTDIRTDGRTDRIPIPYQHRYRASAH